MILQCDTLRSNIHIIHTHKYLRTITTHFSLLFKACIDYLTMRIRVSVSICVVMYVCILEWVRIHQGTGSIKVGQVE